MEIEQYVLGTLTVPDLLASNQGPAQASQLPSVRVRELGKGPVASLNLMKV